MVAFIEGFYCKYNCRVGGYPNRMQTFVRICMEHNFVAVSGHIIFTLRLCLLLLYC